MSSTQQVFTFSGVEFTFEPVGETDFLVRRKVDGNVVSPVTSSRDDVALKSGESASEPVQPCRSLRCSHPAWSKSAMLLVATFLGASMGLKSEPSEPETVVII